MFNEQHKNVQHATEKHSNCQSATQKLLWPMFFLAHGFELNHDEFKTMTQIQTR